MKEQKSSKHLRDGKGRVVNLCEPASKREKRNLSFVTVLTSAMALTLILMGAMLHMSVNRNVELANIVERHIEGTALVQDVSEKAETETPTE